MTDIGQNEIVVPAESIYFSIKFIPLETHGQSILSSPNVFGMDGDNVLIWDQDEILRFDSNGKFLNRVGRLGKGHGEHGRINSANYDENKKIIYVGNMGGFIYKYDLEGNYIGQFKIAENGEILQTVRFNRQLDALVCETRKYSGEGLQVSLRTVSPEGVEKGTYPIYEDNEQVSCSMTRTGMLRNTSEGVMFMLPFDDKVTLLTQQGIIDTLTMDRGNLRPSRKLCENWDYADELYRTKYQIDNIVVTDKYFYLTVTMDKEQCDLLIDRHSHAFIHDKKYAYGSESEHLSLKGFKHVSFWPWVAFNDKAVDLLPIDRFDDNDLEVLKKIAVNDYPLNDMSNPILVVAEEK
ncbi:hypothetical protein PC1C4_11100 [Paraprevotella clara]|nr:hypothetical protein PC1C4_11100 [Paraprevotella clara]